MDRKLGRWSTLDPWAMRVLMPSKISKFYGTKHVIDELKSNYFKYKPKDQLITLYFSIRKHKLSLGWCFNENWGINFFLIIRQARMDKFRTSNENCKEQNLYDILPHGLSERNNWVFNIIPCKTSCSNFRPEVTKGTYNIAYRCTTTVSFNHWSWQIFGCYELSI